MVKKCSGEPFRSFAVTVLSLYGDTGHLYILLCSSPAVLSCFPFSHLSVFSNETLSNSWLDDRTISDAFVQCKVQYAPCLSRSPLSTDKSVYADPTSPSPLSFPEML